MSKLLNFNGGKSNIRSGTSPFFGSTSKEKKISRYKLNKEEE
ncbi:hypothetical protein [Clostridium gasigenes]|nr:hypothetical protein [Clostridium gasigenes]